MGRAPTVPCYAPETNESASVTECHLHVILGYQIWEELGAQVAAGQYVGKVIGVCRSGRGHTDITVAFRSVSLVSMRDRL